MSPALPDGDAAPSDGALPPSVAAGAQDRAFGVYLHVPFCTVRCGYCDFNTYTAVELGGGASQSSYAATAVREIALGARVLTGAGLPARPVSTVFVGGGTPTVLPADDLVAMLRAVDDAWGLADGAEVTTEANPDSVTPASLAALAAGGFTRVSFGMQSAVPHVLATLERTHDPARIPDVVRWARDAGLAVSLDLIYGTPGESLADWRTSLEGALATGVDHVSAYALVVEDGTRMAAQVRRGELVLPDADDQAAKYELADDLLTAAGLGWYEVSNWARTPAHACRHNLAYWRGDDWWGVGPGAHSHVGGVRWWNVKHPRAYDARLAAGLSPAAGREVVDAEGAALERLMLGVRLAQGMPLESLTSAERGRVAGLVADELVDGRALLTERRLLLTRRGRLLADLVVRELAGFGS
ncbi:radical SAM family heme chaperone HemW [Cellulomonas sp.]|uniref:radical SAM family heme chaperone HemW n=1 Tax=Cellulomonas sp. TaxID=40001 RepID=UPI002583FB7A|nr:radical SAM family heme chaperone HemW [Cellulomonas sp.]MCR6690407.1 radical SAM family heme chaperone HemW [Cellulomonas sp.]